jgi:hypothetical protein
MVRPGPAAVLALGLLLAVSVRGDNEAQQNPAAPAALVPADRAAQPDEETDAAPGAAGEKERQRRQRVVTAAVIILTGIAAIGLLLVAAALVWGNRTRKLVRRSDPPSQPVDPFWYLRKPISQEEQTPDEEREQPSMNRSPAGEPTEDSGRTSDSDETRS